VPAIYANRAFPEAGGLMSYGSNWTDTFRQAGIYCGTADQICEANDALRDQFRMLDDITRVCDDARAKDQFMPSRPGESHPEPLTEPDLTLSRHPARATARRLPPSIEHRVPPLAG
jgi:hypothetical protein